MVNEREHVKHAPFINKQSSTISYEQCQNPSQVYDIKLGTL